MLTIWKHLHDRFISQICRPNKPVFCDTFVAFLFSFYVMYPLLPVSLNCPYLIVLSAFSHLYYPEHILLKCLYQARKIGCHVYIYIYILCACIRDFELASISASWLLIQCHVVYSEKKDIVELICGGNWSTRENHRPAASHWQT